MKSLYLAISLLLTYPSFAQKQITFLSHSKNRDISLHKAMLQNNPAISTGEYIFDLPTGKCIVNLSPSSIPQYNKVLSDEIWFSSRAQIWSGTMKGEHHEKLMIVTLDGFLKYLHWENEKILYKLERVLGNEFLLSNNSNQNIFNGKYCGTPDKIINRSQESKRLAKASCKIIDIALVTDLGKDEPQHQIGLIEARLLDWIASVQMYMNFFEMDITLHARQLIIPVNESPFPSDINSGFIAMNDFMKQWLLDKGFTENQFSVTVGITKFNYNTENFIGYTFLDGSSLANIIMEIQPQSNGITTMLLTHELGHAFGAGHDSQDLTYIMSPTINENGLWSPESKSQINNYLGSNDVSKILKDCPETSFSAAALQNEVLLTWDVTYEEDVALYVISHIGVGILDSIVATSNEKIPSHYEFIHHTPTQGTNYYSLTQISTLGRVNYKLFNNAKFGNETSAQSQGISPNPFGENLHLEFSSSQEFLIYDATGRLLFKNSMTSATTDINTSQWVPGLYLIRINGKIYKAVK